MFTKLCLSVFLLSLFATTSLFAQESQPQEYVPTLYGTETQPGHRLHREISDLIISGEYANRSISVSIRDALIETSNTLTSNARTVVRQEVSLTEHFYTEMVKYNDLQETLKIILESKPAKNREAIILSLVLYPSYAKYIYDASVVSSVLSEEEIGLLVLEYLEADTNLLTVTGSYLSNIPNNIPPLGAGIGARGTGGGGITASSN